jgi:heavy metal translocating P-type ATPase
VLVADGAGAWRLAGAAEIAPGMKLKILAGECVPVDLEVCPGEDGASGDVEVTLGVLTGAAAPVTRRAGEEVPAGAVPVSGALFGVARRAAKESTLERLAELAKSLKERPSRLQRLGDAFATALVPLVALLAVGTFALGVMRVSFDHAVLTSLAVVLAACPCTYGVATPLVLWLALRKGLEHGVCIRNAAALEDLAGVEAVAFDKTGTLTDPRLAVIGADLTGAAPRAEVAALVGALETDSRHPVARALAVWAGDQKGHSTKISDCKSLVGRGVSAIDSLGRGVRLGSMQWLKECGAGADGGKDDEAAARVGLTRDGVLLARFRIGEALRPEASAAIGALRSQGMAISMLTGDSEGGARAVAAGLGIEAYAALSPSDKVERLGRLGKKTAMVGDGLNDAPALAGAGPSFAMDGGTSLARGMAQVSLLRPDLRLVPWTLSLARRAMKVGYQNLIGSTIYNLLFLGLAASGALRPVWAGISMLTSSLLTLGSSLRVSAIEGPEGGAAPVAVDDDADAPIPLVDTARAEAA